MNNSQTGRELTLPQVQATGRFASRLLTDATIEDEHRRNRGRFEYMDGVVVYIPHIRSDSGAPAEWPITAPETGWHHLPGCDCELCHG